MDDNELIDTLGGTVAVAKLCSGVNGNITPQAVTQWRRNGIPPARRQYLEAIAPKRRRRRAGRAKE